MTYQEWLDKEGFDQTRTSGGSAIVCHKDGRYVWQDDDGAECTGMPPRKIWEAGYETRSKEKDDYLKRLLSENMDYHNQSVFYRTILEKHGLLEEAEGLMKEVLGSKG